jgi:predicted component of type VI protein secretion system
MTVEVHWHEGLFLQPHHLQAFGRQVRTAGVGTDAWAGATRGAWLRAG